jgi:hypothetical protein
MLCMKKIKKKKKMFCSDYFYLNSNKNDLFNIKSKNV